MITNNTKKNNDIKSSLVKSLSDNFIGVFIKDDYLTFKNADKSIALRTDNNLYYIILNMIKFDNSFIRMINHKNKKELLGNRICSLNPHHKDRFAQHYYYDIEINNESVIYCNNCIDTMSRYSKRKIQIIGNIRYKKLKKIYLNIRKSSIYYFLDSDCFREIFSYCLLC